MGGFGKNEVGASITVERAVGDLVGTETTEVT